MFYIVCNGKGNARMQNTCLLLNLLTCMITDLVMKSLLAYWHKGAKQFSLISDVHHSSRCSVHRTTEVQAVCFSK